MYTHLGYAKIPESEHIWEIVFDNEDGTVDVSIDDLQGDMTVIGVDKRILTLVEKSEYEERIKKLEQENDEIYKNH